MTNGLNLSKCPHCGGVPIIRRHMVPLDWSVFVGCSFCGGGFTKKPHAHGAVEMVVDELSKLWEARI